MFPEEPTLDSWFQEWSKDTGSQRGCQWDPYYWRQVAHWLPLADCSRATAKCSLVGNGSRTQVPGNTLVSPIFQTLRGPEETVVWKNGIMALAESHWCTGERQWKAKGIIDQLKAMCRSYKGVRLNPECCVLCSEKMEHNFGSLGVFRGTGVFSS